MRVGDPDDDSLANEYVGEDLPGGSTPTPDQSNVDEIGRAYGLQEEERRLAAHEQRGARPSRPTPLGAASAATSPILKPAARGSAPAPRV